MKPKTPNDIYGFTIKSPNIYDKNYRHNMTPLINYGGSIIKKPAVVSHFHHKGQGMVGHAIRGTANNKSFGAYPPVIGTAGGYYHHSHNHNFGSKKFRAPANYKESSVKIHFN